MQFEDLQKGRHIEFAKDIYQYSFPEDERRDFSLMLDLLENEKGVFRFLLIFDKEEGSEPVGIISVWEFDNYIYIEHFAISQNIRSKGYGKRTILSLRELYNKPILIEVEPAETPDAVRRIEFYNRLSFFELDYDYTQPPYSKDKQALSLRLMIDDKSLLEKTTIEDMEKNIHKIVYKV